MRRTALSILIIVGVVAAPLALYASHQFTDVPTSQLFHSAIAWLSDNGVTKGCNPPANDKFCPDDDVTRGQMSAFLKRLSEGKIVDAATAVNADNADTLGGKAPSYYQGSVAGSLISSLTPAAAVETRIGQIAGFNVPQGGGALYANANMSMMATFVGDAAIVWLEVDGSGACDSATLPQTAAVHLFFTEPIASFSTSMTAAVNAGNHQVDLCAFTTGDVDFEPGALTVQWVETTQIGTTATASTGVSPQEKLAEVASASLAE